MRLLNLLVPSIIILLSGCGGSSPTESATPLPQVRGKWILDSGEITARSTVPPTVEFVPNPWGFGATETGTYIYTSASLGVVSSTYTLTKSQLFVSDGLGNTEVSFLPESDGAGTLKLTALGPPPAQVQFWRSIN